MHFLTLYVPCIVTNSINKPTRCTLCMYLFYNLFATLHVSNDCFVHHQEFINLLYLQLCTTHTNVSRHVANNFCLFTEMHNATSPKAVTIRVTGITQSNLTKLSQFIAKLLITQLPHCTQSSLLM